VLDSSSCSRHADPRPVGFHTAGDEYVELQRLSPNPPPASGQNLQSFTSPTVCFLLTAFPPMPLLCNPQVIAVTWTAFTYQSSCAADRHSSSEPIHKMLISLENGTTAGWAFAPPLDMQGL